MGYLFEELVWKFNEQANEEAGVDKIKELWVFLPPLEEQKAIAQ